VSIQRASDQGFEQGEINLPLVQGDKLGTKDGRTEIDFGKSNYLRVDGDTQIDFNRMPQREGDPVGLHLLAGTGQLALAFGALIPLAPTDGIPNIHHNSVLSPVPSLPAVNVFDDRTLYYDSTNPLGSVIHPNTGTQIRIQSISAQNSFMQIEVRPVK
jgi:hypothetical protein